MRRYTGGRLILRPFKVSEYEKMTDEEKEENNILESDIGRWMPQVADIEVKVANEISNENDIERFFADYINYHARSTIFSQRVDTGILFEVSDKDADNFCYQAERSGFRYDEV